MTYYAEPIIRLIKEFSKLPGVGEKTASRFAFYVLNTNKEYVQNLVKSLVDVKEKIMLCQSCFNLSDKNPCSICSDAARRDNVICVVEDIKDMAAIEKMGGFKGRYHILHGTLSPLKGIGPEDIKVNELIDRVRQGVVEEIILATNSDMDGEATALYITRLLKPIGVRVTRIATGIPVGSDLEYIDGATLGRAMEGRREV
ncbi:MAG: recombination protein RecR [Deltaproteobacteria bacterium RIFCSPLOWO2_12_FULL_43_16]|nr:MAG: recombination protein RecR [Deltaproteobacteria bacterium RIFCSPHIGHO2_02_FULL_43_33]OGQ41200.1 MAG: recombination protein RecR [Deltaproteobacteria bacterium RIFCSPLOWO2_01_FULL_42_9]OGQ61290.1 MAG: recombination protein RecR [Deltaproteobacteria bacterium RIFCSPLOWO2_12_FULL_43_16]HBR16786.1 recombination protein RecR [Deltaproteobacteria bacterium]